MKVKDIKKILEREQKVVIIAPWTMDGVYRTTAEEIPTGLLNADVVGVEPQGDELIIRA